MDDQTVNDYVTALDQELKIKETKSQRLAQDIQRHKKILSAARDESTRRGLKTTSYRGKEHPILDHR